MSSKIVPDRDRRAFLGDATLLAGVASIAAALPSTANAQATATATLTAEITQVLEQTEAIWNSQEFHRLVEVWDRDDDEPWYVPEEIPEPFFSWPQIEKYWNPGRKVLEAFRWKFSNVRVKSLTPDLTLAIFNHEYEIQIVGGREPPTAGFDRVLALFRKKPEGWRHILYAQCPLGPDTYIRAMREKMVSPDFADFRDSLNDDN